MGSGWTPRSAGAAAGPERLPLAAGPLCGPRSSPAPPPVTVPPPHRLGWPAPRAQSQPALTSPQERGLRPPELVQPPREGHRARRRRAGQAGKAEGAAAPRRRSASRPRLRTTASPAAAAGMSQSGDQATGFVRALGLEGPGHCGRGGEPVKWTVFLCYVGAERSDLASLWSSSHFSLCR